MACGQDMQLKGERCGYGRAVARKPGWPLCFTVARFTLALQPCNILVVEVFAQKKRTILDVTLRVP